MPDTVPSAIHIVTHLILTGRCQYDPYFMNEELKYRDSNKYLAQGHAATKW